MTAPERPASTMRMRLVFMLQGWVLLLGSI
jgi:hypothetical protein